MRCFPETGRMHQIRVHLAHAGFPILGDKLYSGDGSEYIRWMAAGWTPELAGKLVLPRHALHASRLELPWQGVTKSWEAPLAADLEEFVEGRPSTEIPGIVIWSRHD